MRDRLDDPALLAGVLALLDELVSQTGQPLPDDEREHGWTDSGWDQMADIVSRWRVRIAERGFLSSTDVGWQVRALFDFDHVDTGYGVAHSFVALGNSIADALN